jgi:hypothetical protein
MTEVLQWQHLGILFSLDLYVMIVHINSPVGSSHDFQSTASANFDAAQFIHDQYSPAQHPRHASAPGLGSILWAPILYALNNTADWQLQPTTI